MTSNNGSPSSQATTLPSPPPLAAAAPKSEKPGKTEHHRDSTREAVETIVFVTVLVLLLKSFVAEAFVIPTGSMAETLLGYRAFVTCPACGHEFPVNVSEEIEPSRGHAQKIDGCTCPNCRMHIDRTKDDKWVREPVFLFNTGDRVLVSKWPMQKLDRWDVVVFKYPQEPVKNTTPMNYIKRLVGLPGETIAVLNGDLFVSNEPIDYSDRDKPERSLDLWHTQYTYDHAPTAQDAFRNHKFTILRKPPAQILSMRRLVFDNDQQAQDLVAAKVPPRWQSGNGWTPNDRDKPTEFRAGDGKDVSWLRYRHYFLEHSANRPPIAPFEPGFIRNVMGYNMPDTPRVNKSDEDRFWVGDLILDCSATVAANQGELILELSKGKYRYQARFDVASGECRLIAKGPVSEREIGKHETKLKGPGTYKLRFGNVDERLIVWLNGSLPFGDGALLPSDLVDRSGKPDDINDKQPASIGVANSPGLTIKHIQLWRDTFYTPYAAPGSDRSHGVDEAERTIFVQPGHYLCMGDNSTQSSDGRDWGLVPERLMLGRAVMVYFPFWPLAPRFGPIR